MPLLALMLTAAAAGLLAAAVALRSPQPAPGATTGNALRAGAAVAIGGAAVLGLVTYLVLRTEALGRVDAGAARWSHDHATDVTQAAIRTVTQLGETWLVAVAGLLVAAVAWRRGASLLVAPFLIAVVVGDKVATTAIKELVDRARPTLDPIAQTLGPSFPSGHTSTAAAFFAGAALVLGCGRSRRARAALAGGAVGIAVAVACSRVLLDVHWLSDVVAGLALGWAWFAVCAIVFGGRLLRSGVTAERIETVRAPGSRPPDVAEV